MKIGRRNRSGSILVTVLLMLSVLALLVAVVANDSAQTLKSVSQSGRDTQAKYAAYAGLEFALNKLRQDPQFIGEKISDRHGRIVESLDGLERFQYQVQIWNNIPEEGDDIDEMDDLVGPGSVVVTPDTVYLVSSGTNLDRGEEVILSSLGGTARRVRPVFDDAAFARSKLALSGEGSLVDAWDSHGGYDKYVEGSFPGESGGGGGGGGGGGPAPTVQDHEATLGTDSEGGRTLRLLSGARLNGHYRVGPAVDEARAFGSDAGTSSGSTRSGTDTVQHFVTTAQNPDSQVAGVKDESPGASGVSDKKVVVDTKETEVPHFVSPYTDEDCIAPPILDNKRTTQKDKDGKVIKDMDGNPKTNPPAAVTLNPGGYTHIDVPFDQTLELKPGVYFFRDEINVDGGSIIKSGDGPAIIFCGKKAIFKNANVNLDGNTGNVQLCFTDDEKDDDELSRVADDLRDILRGSDGDALSTEAAKNLISPMLSNSDPKLGRTGFSYLEVSGDTKFHGSISGQNLVGQMNGGEIFGSIMGNIINGRNAKIHQDLALKGSNLMNAGGWKLEGVHQIR